jgi:hypothetical protein
MEAICVIRCSLLYSHSEPLWLADIVSLHAVGLLAAACLPKGSSSTRTAE